MGTYIQTEGPNPGSLIVKEEGGSELRFSNVGVKDSCSIGVINDQLFYHSHSGLIHADISNFIIQNLHLNTLTTSVSADEAVLNAVVDTAHAKNGSFKIKGTVIIELASQILPIFGNLELSGLVGVRVHLVIPLALVSIGVSEPPFVC
eukprot:TRINITY_DN6036_c0_g5_i1.p1 TRINITY_DN6036_c0_g5~~TRINITY_DN6036_c0_g5_i1.p1  ORF type:complete len:148 (-),score=36.69 TRINITY_DN6036_c0_g5_i1:125-568(-)